MQKRYMVVKGRKGQLVGSPFSANRFIGQAPKNWPDGEMPKRKADRYQPVIQVIPWHADVLKPVRKGCLTELATVMAESPDAALKAVQKKCPEAFEEEAVVEEEAEAVVEEVAAPDNFVMED